jgi:hypothetical protein
MVYWQGLLYGGGVKEVPVHGGLVALVDDADYELVSQYSWWPNRGTGSQTIYARAYMRGAKRQQSVLLHRLILSARHSVEIDHENLNGLDCQRHNLRLATVAQNKQNTPKYRTYKGIPTTSRFKGVFWRRERNTWVARGYLNGKGVYLGSFKEESDAAAAYNTFALDHYGEFSRLNIIEEN